MRNNRNIFFYFFFLYAIDSLPQSLASRNQSFNSPLSAFSSSPKKHLEPSDKIQASANVGWGIYKEGVADI